MTQFPPELIENTSVCQPVLSLCHRLEISSSLDRADQVATPYYQRLRIRARHLLWIFPKRNFLDLTGGLMLRGSAGDLS